jgi:hypothetical protein
MIHAIKSEVFSLALMVGGVYPSSAQPTTADSPKVPNSPQKNAG